MDLNLAFYDWLLSDETAEIVIRHVKESSWNASKKQGYQAIFSCVESFRKDLTALKILKREKTKVPANEVVKYHYLASRSLHAYLSAISDVSTGFDISPREFRVSEGTLNPTSLQSMLFSPPEILGTFAKNALAESVLPVQTKLIGISCIGMEQLYFTLLLGQLLKAATNIPIIVGGTVLIRLFRRGRLSNEWFEKYFDIIVAAEGEIPCERMLANLRKGRPLQEKVPGIIYREDDSVVSTRRQEPLKASECPVPDFSVMPLEAYYSAEITLPLLSSRGCYWGKCEFCSHGMVYGKRYSAYSAQQLLNTVVALSRRYRAKHFAFYDEAIPPTVIRRLGSTFPASSETGWYFTGLIRFEKSYRDVDFERLRRIGFRSLYVGLESASNRVLRLMNKGTTQETILANLGAATRGGIWMHCFVFFGFPGETETDANKTYEFVMDHPDRISSFGCGTFMLEHGAPIFEHLDDFGIRLTHQQDDTIGLAYFYELPKGINKQRAAEWTQKLNQALVEDPKFSAVGWIPREHLSYLLSIMSADDLVKTGMDMASFGWLPRSAKIDEVVSLLPRPSSDYSSIIVNRLSCGVLGMNGNFAELMRLFYEEGLDLKHIADHSPTLVDRLVLTLRPM